MKTIKLFFFILFLTPVLLFAQSGPKLEVEGGESINTGNHLRNKEVHYDIQFKNTGDENLKIVSVTATCGCSSALASNDDVKPGDEGTIKFTFNGLGMGLVHKNIIVTTNEKENNEHTIALTMNMVDPVTLAPESILTSGKVGDDVKQNIIFTNLLDKNITISEITSNSPVVKITADKMEVPSNDTATLAVSIKLYEDSPVNAAVIIKTSEGEFQVPILVDITPSGNQ